MYIYAKVGIARPTEAVVFASQKRMDIAATADAMRFLSHLARSLPKPFCAHYTDDIDPTSFLKPKMLNRFPTERFFQPAFWHSVRKDLGSV
jgi:hypothetical protein